MPLMPSAGCCVHRVVPVAGKASARPVTVDLSHSGHVCVQKMLRCYECASDVDLFKFKFRGAAAAGSELFLKLPAESIRCLGGYCGIAGTMNYFIIECCNFVPSSASATPSYVHGIPCSEQALKSLMASPRRPTCFHVLTRKNNDSRSGKYHAGIRFLCGPRWISCSQVFSVWLPYH